VALGFIFFLSQQFSVFFDDFPKFKDQANENMTDFQDYLTEKGPFAFDSDNWLKNNLSSLLEEQENFISQIFNATTSTLVALGVQPVYIFFMLYYRHHFREFLFIIAKEKDHDTLRKILFEITSVTKNYVTGIFIVVLILCVLNTLGLLIIGLEYALLLGVISAVVNFIPYFGTLIGGSIPLLYSLVSPDPSKAIGVLFLFLGIQILENNILTPTITGGRVAINPLFTIFAIIIGGITWGIPGMFVSVPFLGIFKVICQNIEPLKPVSFVLSSKNSQEKNKSPLI
jgi:predicted PurR-regulated permease PerM